MRQNVSKPTNTQNIYDKYILSKFKSEISKLKLPLNHSKCVDARILILWMRRGYKSDHKYVEILCNFQEVSSRIMKLVAIIYN